MPNETLTEEGAQLLRPSAEAAPRAFIVIDYVDDAERASQVVDLPDGVDVTFGRSASATVTVEHDSVSRIHARIRRNSDQIEVEDLGSRNGTWVNGERILALQRVSAGDEIAIGPLIAVVGVTSALRRVSPIATAAAGEARLTAEVDRSVRYHRPLTLALVHLADDDAVEAVAHALRPMDLMAEDAGDDYLLILPELDRTGGAATIERMREVARNMGAPMKAATALSPDDGTTVEALISQLRSGLRTGIQGKPPPLPSGESRITIDPAMKRVYRLVERIADTPITVLILGETGVGKEIVAEEIHRRSSRRSQPFIKLNCAALTENLLESELFGHERGAFTGADRRKVGFFEAANGGTLFLDEIGEMPAALQAKLLRVLERKVITRVGGTAEVPTDTRLIAATHRDLDAEARAGRFRQDLLFRICGFTIAIPPLRDRPIEIVPLAEHFAKIAAAEHGRPAPGIGPDARAALVSYGWPGNVRELRNAIERALVLCDDTISAVDLPDRLHPGGRPPVAGSDVRGHLAEVERATIVAALEAEQQNQTRAARRLGLSRRTLIYRMEKYGLKTPPQR
ncbi:MAG TPA: sigma 54-interacting transcriptional regulator [Kofleriaceae bacterium]|nr:sigma 54-interacting transcriptional regulator [Kofleriaceae bacterium]